MKKNSNNILFYIVPLLDDSKALLTIRKDKK